MTHRIFFRTLAMALVLFAVAMNKAAAEFKGDVNVSGSEVEVLVRHQDGRPASDVTLRLFHGAQWTTIASARTDPRGRWRYLATEPGLYEIYVETPSGSAGPLRLPFEINEESDAATTESFFSGPLSRWIAACALLLAAAGLLRTTRLPSTAFFHGFRWLMASACMAAGVGLLVLGGWHPESGGPPSPATGKNLAANAREFLRSRNIAPLSGSLMSILLDPKHELISTQSHALLSQKAPDFTLRDHKEQPMRLSERSSRGPVVLVFYLGYNCNHCVGQLFSLHDDMDRFRELGAEILAVSPDSPEKTRKRFAQYGPFAFPVLSDPENKVAQQYGIYLPPTEKEAGELQHGTFIIGRDGHVHWVQFGSEPFTDGRTLLRELARIEGRLPKLTSCAD